MNDQIPLNIQEAAEKATVDYPTHWVGVICDQYDDWHIRAATSDKALQGSFKQIGGRMWSHPPMKGN